MRLLIVDDEIYAIQGILDDVVWEEFGFEEILTACSYQQAVNIFNNKQIDIIICDIEMPHGSGISLVEWIRKKQFETECIFLTCHSDFEFARHAVSLECIDYLLKPVSTEMLHEVLMKACQKVKTRENEHQIAEYGKIYMNLMVDNLENEKSDEDIVTIVEKYVYEHISESLKVESIAQEHYISAIHLSRLFKKKYNLTLNEYITRQKMYLAKELLKKQECTVSMVSCIAGYTNYSYFTKCFRKQFNVSPSEYKRLYEEGKI